MKGQAVILGLLMNGPQTGYELREKIEDQLSHFYDGGYGMIYPTLKKLEQNGLVTKDTVIQDDKPNKNVFAITDAGKATFQEELSADLAEDSFKSDYLMRLYFGEFLNQKQLYDLTQRKIATVQEKLNALESKQKEWDSTASPEQRFTYEYGIAQYRGILRLLADELKVLKKTF